MKKQKAWIGMLLILGLTLTGCLWHHGGHNSGYRDGYGHFNDRRHGPAYGNAYRDWDRWR